MNDRKASPLRLQDGEAPWDTTTMSESSTPAASRSTPPQEDFDRPQEDPDRPYRGADRLPLAGQQKRRAAAKKDPFDRVSVNYNLPLVVRRMTRILAARWEMNDQDVVLEALLNLFGQEGLDVPTDRAEYDRMVRENLL